MPGRCRLKTHFGHDRRADPAVDRLHHRVEPILRLDQLARATPLPQLGQPPQESFVDRLVNPQRENTDSLQARTEHLEHLVFIADLPVGDQHKDAVAVVAGPAEQPDGLVERLRRSRCRPATRLSPGTRRP